jgi:hypothetical protein
MATLKTSVTSKLLRTQEKLDIVKKEEATDKVRAKEITEELGICVNLTCGYIKLRCNTQVASKLDKDITAK